MQTMETTEITTLKKTVGKPRFDRVRDEDIREGSINGCSLPVSISHLSRCVCSVILMLFIVLHCVTTTYSFDRFLFSFLLLIVVSRILCYARHNVDIPIFLRFMVTTNSRISIHSSNNVFVGHSNSPWYFKHAAVDPRLESFQFTHCVYL